MPKDEGGEDTPWLWVRIDSLGKATDLVDAATRAIEAGAEGLVVPEGAGADMANLSRGRVMEVREDELFEGGKPAGRIARVRSRADVGKATRMLRAEGMVLIEPKDWKVIPLEDLVAAQRGEGLPGRLLAQVASPQDARTALGALEHGCDGVVVAPSSIDEVGELVAAVRAVAVPDEALHLSVGRVVRVHGLGLGDRACVDTCDMLRPGEGLLVGSSSQGLLLVHGETVENPYAAVRPFRVNAGAVHSYIVVPGGRTSYLSEAEAGSLVLLVGADGAGRPSHVGRLKIERRPLVLLEVEAGGRRFNAILQNAETVRLVTPEGSASVSSLKEGDEVVVHLPGGPASRNGEVAGEAGGRHFGRAVPERIIER